LKPESVVASKVEGGGVLFMKLSQARENFTKWACGELSATSIEVYEFYISLFIEWCGNKRVPEVGLFEHILEFRKHLEDTGKKDSTINLAMIAFRQFFKLLENTGNGDFDFSWTAIPYKSSVENDSYNPIKLQQQTKLVNEAIKKGGFVGKRDESLLRLFWSTGMRVSEMAALNVRSVNLPDEQSVTAITKKRRDNVEKRTLPFTKYCKKAMQEYLELRNDFGGQALWVSTRGSNSGSRLSVRAIQRRITVYCKQADKLDHKNISPHSFRHALGQRGANAKMDNVMLSSLLGHSSPQGSDVYYNLRNPEVQKEYHDKIGDNSESTTKQIWNEFTETLSKAGEKMSIMSF